MGKSIRIHLVRHGKPDLSRDVWLTRKQYRTWWTNYGTVGLAPDHLPQQETLLAAQKCTCFVSSPLPRAVETARVLAGGQEIRIDAKYVEAPLPPHIVFGWLCAKPIGWGTLSRITWWLGFSGGEESHSEAKKRAWACVEELSDLAATEGAVMVCGHGWFNRMIAKRLRQSGWKRDSAGGDAYWTVRSYIKEI